jgi:hypothetical protein
MFYRIQVIFLAWLPCHPCFTSNGVKSQTILSSSFSPQPLLTR